MRDKPVSPSMKEVAEHAGVAPSSVSRVLNEYPDVSDSMRVKVLEAVAALGYERDLLASSLRRGKTMTIGFMVSDIVNPLFSQILKGAERILRVAGHSVILAHSDGMSTRDVASIRLLRRRRVDGMIISIADDTRVETIQELERLDVPVVLLDRSTRLAPNASSVLADHRTGVRRATEHLLELNHRRIALMTGPQCIKPARERLAGFREGFERRHISVPESLVVNDGYAPDVGAQAMTALLRRHDPPTAVIIGGNLLLVGVIAALHREGWAIGKDISLVSCDDVPLAELHTPPITVVSRDMTQMGVVAAELLIERLTDEDASPQVRMIPTELVVRESTAALR